MNWLKNALLELVGLFVDDIPFTVCIVLWLAISVWGLPGLTNNPNLNAALLFMGCALILVGSVLATVRLRR